MEGGILRGYIAADGQIVGGIAEKQAVLMLCDGGLKIRFRSGDPIVQLQEGSAVLRAVGQGFLHQFFAEYGKLRPQLLRQSPDRDIRKQHIAKAHALDDLCADQPQICGKLLLLL